MIPLIQHELGKAIVLWHATPEAGTTLEIDEPWLLGLYMSVFGGEGDNWGFVLGDGAGEDADAAVGGGGVVVAQGDVKEHVCDFELAWGVC